MAQHLLSVRSPNACHRSNTHRFSVRHYTDTLRQYLAEGYEIVPFRELSGVSGPKVLILRHDIDISPEFALPVLAAESELGVQSTVFIRTMAPGYSLDDVETANQVRSMCPDGFEIGLHYEISEEGERGLASLKQQKRKLEECLGEPVFGAAPHRIATVGRQVPRNWLEEVGLSYDAFQPDFTEHFKYISDSRRRWREGCFCKWVGRADRLQVLTHPVWWRRGSLSHMDELLRLL